MGYCPDDRAEHRFQKRPRGRSLSPNPAEPLDDPPARAAVQRNNRRRRSAPVAEAKRIRPSLFLSGFGPNNAVPTRTIVAPSSMATSRSCDIPMERCCRPFWTASSRKRAKYGRDRSASSDHGGIVINPNNRKCGHPRIASTSAGTSPGAAPALAGSVDNFTSISTESREAPPRFGRPGAARFWPNPRCE